MSDMWWVTQLQQWPRLRTVWRLQAAAEGIGSCCPHALMPPCPHALLMPPCPHALTPSRPHAPVPHRVAETLEFMLLSDSESPTYRARLAGA